MSLSARIAVGPSRRLDALASAVAIAGVAVVAATAATRWPNALAPVVATALATAAVLAIAARRRIANADRFTMIVGERSEIAIDATPAGPIEATWRLTGSTLVWPGFVVLALRPIDSSRRRPATRIVPILDRTLDAEAARALRRYLTWSLRGGNGIDGATLRDAGRR